MLKDIAKDAAMEELSRLSWRVRINFNLIVTFIIIVAYLSISSWKVLETIESYKDLRRRVSALEKKVLKLRMFSCGFSQTCWLLKMLWWIRLFLRMERRFLLSLQR